MVFVESGLNNLQVWLMRPIYIEIKMFFFGTETSGLNSDDSLN